MKNDIVRISHETQQMRDRIKENKEKIKVNKTLPYLVSNVIEVQTLNDDEIFLYQKYFSYSILTHKAKKMKAPISISMLNVKENVP